MIREQNVFYDVIIIGAGAAGIGAARTLQKRPEVSYAVLEAQDRVGGRIQKINFDGVDVDLGAYQLAGFGQDSPFNESIKMYKLPIDTLPGRTKVYYYDESGQILDRQSLKKARKELQNIKQEFLKVSFEERNKMVTISYRKYLEQKLIQRQVNFTEKQEKLFYLLLNMQEQQQASSAQEISTLAMGFESEEQMQADTYPLFKTTFATLIQKMASDLNIKFVQIVSKVSYNSRHIHVETRKGDVFKCHKLICTAPLSHLKRKEIQFVPQLPSLYEETFSKLGFGLFNKIFLSFDQPFWNQDTRRIKISCKERGRFPHFINLSKEGKFILCGFITDKFCQKLRDWTDGQVFDDAVSLLKQVFGDKVKFKKGYYTRWENNEWALGAFSNFGIGVTVKDMISLRQPIADKVWFAGQYMYYENFGTAHGACITGKQAAEEAYATLRKQKLFYQ